MAVDHALFCPPSGPQYYHPEPQYHEYYGEGVCRGIPVISPTTSERCWKLCAKLCVQPSVVLDWRPLIDRSGGFCSQWQWILDATYIIEMYCWCVPILRVPARILSRLPFEIDFDETHWSGIWVARIPGEPDEPSGNAPKRRNPVQIRELDSPWNDPECTILERRTA